MTYLLIQNYNRLTKLVRQAFPFRGREFVNCLKENHRRVAKLNSRVNKKLPHLSARESLFG